MSEPAIDPVIALALRGALTLLLGSAARHKLRDLAGFRTALANYELLPRAWVAPAAGVLVAAELVIAVALWLPGAAGAAALATATLLIMYTVAIVTNLIRGRRDIECGCSGPARRQQLSGGLVVRNMVLTGTALVSALPGTIRALSWIDAVTVVFAVVTLTLLYLATDGLLANAPHLAAFRHVHLTTPSRHEVAHA